jgi:basic membrane protein A
MIIPAVDDYITGYRNGASCANPSAITLVRYTNDFGNPQLGAQVAQELIQAGADVLFAVAGPTGSGVLITATQSGAWGIGVDVDQFFTVFQGGAQPGAYHLLTSAIKLIDNAVYDTISDVVSSTFTAGTALYGLAEQGVELAPYHLTDASIPQAVKDEVAQVRQEIIQGTRDVNQLCDSAMLKVGMIPGTGGINDNGFNENSYAGLLRAQSELGVVGTVYELGDPPDFAATIEQCVMEGNKLCIGVGFELGAPVEEAANTFTQTKFATLDVEYGVYSPNLRGILFASEEPGYLAGVLAGEMTESNRIGAIGGMKIPPVDRFIDGYRNGASCANPFVTTVVSYTNDFTNPELGEQFARQMLDSGADVLFPVAGPTGEGALITTTQSGAWAIGVDVDQFNSVFQGGSVAGADHLLTSVLKRLDNAVYNTISDVISGTFGAGTLTYHLADGGVGLAPYHLADAAIPGSVKLQVDQAQMRIIQGLIDVNQPCDRRLFLPALMRINP